MRKNFLAFFGHLDIDIVLRVPKLPERGSVAIEGHGEAFGGTAGNFAMVAASLGIPFHLYSAVSMTSHSAFLKFLEARSIDTSHIYTGGEYGPVCYSVTDGRDQIYYMYQGPMGKGFFQGIDHGKEDYSYVHLGTGPPDDYLVVAQTFTGKKVFDPGQELGYRYSEQMLRSFLDVADIVIFNDHEENAAIELLHTEREDLRSTLPTLIVTHGEKGSSVFSNGHERIVRPRIVPDVYDTIGAGDSFLAGFYLGLNQNMGIQESCALGSIVASEAIRKPIRDFIITSGKIMEIYNLEAPKLLE